MKTVRLALNAMATRFELILRGDDEPKLRAAGEEAIREIAHLDQRLSFYSATSELTRLNSQASSRPVKVAPDVFQLLAQVKRLVRDTHGTFDPSVVPLLHCWGFTNGTGKVPSEEELLDAKRRAGFQHVILDGNATSVYFDQPGVALDLGGIGKGFALDEAAGILSRHGIRHALLHGGTSTVLAIGRGYDDVPWKIGIQDRETLLATIVLENEALSVSAASGKRFIVDGIEYAHILDPRSGRPSTAAAVAAVSCSSATKADALSTAALVLGKDADCLLNLVTGLGVWRDAHPDSSLLMRGFRHSS